MGVLLTACLLGDVDETSVRVLLPALLQPGGRGVGGGGNVRAAESFRFSFTPSFVVFFYLQKLNNPVVPVAGGTTK